MIDLSATEYPARVQSVETLPGVNVSRLMGERVLRVEVPRETPETGPRRIPPIQLAHLRGLFASYQAALDATLLGMGPAFDHGGCRVDLVRGLVAPPERG